MTVICFQMSSAIIYQGGNPQFNEQVLHLCFFNIYLTGKRLKLIINLLFVKFFILRIGHFFINFKKVFVGGVPKEWD